MNELPTKVAQMEGVSADLAKIGKSIFNLFVDQISELRVIERAPSCARDVSCTMATMFCCMIAGSLSDPRQMLKVIETALGDEETIRCAAQVAQRLTNQSSPDVH